MRETLQRLLLSSASKCTHGASAAKCANIFHMRIHPRRCLPRPDKHRTGLRSGICLFNTMHGLKLPHPRITRLTVARASALPMMLEMQVGGLTCVPARL